MTPLDPLVELVVGRDVIVMGSAPAPSWHDDVPIGALTWGVNGGISTFKCAEVDIWNVNARSYEPPTKEQLHRQMLRQAAGVRVTLAVLNQREEDALPIFFDKMRRQQTVIDAHLAYDTLQRDRLLQITGGLTRDAARHAPSAGMLSTALACFCGAKSVWLRGFSWRPGYQYMPGVKTFARGHIFIDKMVLGNLLRRYPGVIHHDLELPPRFWTKEDFMAAANGEVKRDIATATAATLVRAKAPGIYKHRRRVGAEFRLDDPKDFKPSWMEPVVADEVPIQDKDDQALANSVHERVRQDQQDTTRRAELVQDRVRREREEVVRRSRGGDKKSLAQGAKIPELQPNAADPKPATDAPTGDTIVLE